MKKERTLRAVVLALLLMAVMVAGTACSVSWGPSSGHSGSSGTGKTPTIFNQPRKEYDGFQTLKEAEMDGEGSMDDIKCYVPKGSVTSDDEYCSGYTDGGMYVFLMRLDSSVLSHAKGDVKTLLETYGEFRSPDADAAEEQISAIKTAHDGDIAYQTNLRTSKNGAGEYVTRCETSAVIRLDSKNVLKMEVSLYADTPNAEQIVEELTAYYDFPIYCDQAKAKLKQEEFRKKGTATPLTGNVVEKDGFCFQLPSNYKKVESGSNNSTDCYCPDGTLSVTENLFLISNAHGIKNVKNLPKDKLRKTIESMLEKQLEDADVSMQDTNCPLADGIAYRLDMEINDVKEAGYVLIYDEYLVMIFTASDSEISQSQMDTLTAVFQSVQVGAGA